MASLLRFVAYINHSQHRTIFLTGPQKGFAPSVMVSGMMYHASYVKIPDTQPPQSKWIIETRSVDDLSKSKSLVLLYRIAHYVDRNMAEFKTKFEEVLHTVPLGKSERERRIGPCIGHPKLGGYDCIVVSVSVDHVETCILYCVVDW